jgi:hypothetical protein
VKIGLSQLLSNISLTLISSSDRCAETTDFIAAAWIPARAT